MEIKVAVYKKLHDILCLTETNLNKFLKDEVLHVEGYNTWRNERQEEKTERSNETHNCEMPVTVNVRREILTIIVITAEGEIIITTLYTPPQTNARSSEEYNEMACNNIQKFESSLRTLNEIIISTRNLNSTINWEALYAGAEENA